MYVSGVFPSVICISDLLLSGNPVEELIWFIVVLWGGAWSASYLWSADLTCAVLCLCCSALVGQVRTGSRLPLHYRRATSART